MYLSVIIRASLLHGPSTVCTAPQYAPHHFMGLTILYAPHHWMGHIYIKPHEPHHCMHSTTVCAATELAPPLNAPYHCMHLTTVCVQSLYAYHNCIGPTTVCVPPLYRPHHCMLPTIVWAPPLCASHHCMGPTIVWAPPLYGPHHCMRPTIVWAPPLYATNHCMRPPTACAPPLCAAHHVPIQRWNGRGASEQCLNNRLVLCYAPLYDFLTLIQAFVGENTRYEKETKKYFMSVSY